MSETNKAAVARLTRELFNDGGNPDVVDELLAEEFVDRTPGAGLGNDREAYKQRGLT